MSSDAAAAMDASLIPPVEMLFDGSFSAEQFVAFGEGFVHNFLIPRAGLLPSDVFLDLGESGRLRLGQQQLWNFALA